MDIIRKKRKIIGTADRPRLSVYKSLKHMHAQIVDDINHKTIVGMSTKSIKDKGTKLEKSAVLGRELAKKAIASGIEKVVFDRGRFKYHGRVKAMAAAAREGGLEF